MLRNDDVRGGGAEGGLDFTLDIPQAMYNVYINKTIDLLEYLKLWIWNRGL